MNKKLLFLILVIATVPLVSHAAGFLDSIACIRTGRCGLEEIASGFVILIRYLLGMMAAVSLVYFVWGGVYWIGSGGNMSKIEKGKNIMVNTILALVVAFTSYLVINFFVNDLLGAKSGYRVSNECPANSDGRVCNSGSGRNYECYQGMCVTKCEIADKESDAGIPISGWTIDPSWSLSCADINNVGEPPNLVWQDLNNYCPGGEEIKCIARKADGTVVRNVDMIPAP